MSPEEIEWRKKSDFCDIIQTMHNEIENSIQKALSQAWIVENQSFDAMDPAKEPMVKP